MIAAHEKYKCPVCGHNEPAKQYDFSDRFSGMSAGVTPPPTGYPFPGVQFAVEPASRLPANYHFDCKGCSTKYWDISDRDIESILYDLRIDDGPEANLIKMYGISLPDLIRNHRTGIIREYRRFGIEDKKIIICVNSHEIRSSIFCIRQHNNDGSLYYKVKSVRRP